MGNTNSSITFNDRLPVDYTFDNVDDDGLINLQTYKRHRCLREVGLPYRKANSRRVVERAKRRESRPYLSLAGNKLAEAKSAFNVNELDSEFLSRAENNPSLNLLAEDFFKKANRKKEIQYLIKKHYFPEFNLSATLDDDDITDVAVNSMIARLKKENPETFKILFTMLGGQGIGPGEAMLYFIYNKAYIHGGFGKTGDIEIGNKIYECKAIQIIGARPNEINDLRLGGTVDTASIVSRIKALYKKQIDSNYEVGAKGYEGAQGTDPIIALRTNPKTRAEFKKIESDYQKLAYEKYFELHEFIFLNNSTKLEEMGKIVMPVGKIKQSSIQIERITQNILKPVILKNK
jgi:hypothetical protein